MKFDDNTQLQFGNGADLQFYHTGGIGVLYNNTGDFRFRQNTNDGDIDFQCDDGAGGTTSYLVLDGGDVSTIINTVKVLMPNLPTSDPSVANELWNDSGTLKISAG